MTRTEALARHLECSVNDIEPSTYDDDMFEADGGEYLVLTNNKADQRTADYIKESVWAFNSCFLASRMPEGIEEDVIEVLQAKCEGANKAILRMIEDVDDFIKDAILVDGRGHFISSYDGEEYEVDEYFIYRTN